MKLEARFLEPGGLPDVATRRRSAELASRLPGLVAAARQIANSVAHGVHGRRQAGMGESFWQFRPFTSGESTAGIDWRRSARDDRTYVREREWEAAQTVWLWIDRSASMSYQSNLAPAAKADRALVLGLAMADLLVRGGERVGLLGLTRPLATRGVIERLADALLLDAPRGEWGMPPAVPLQARSRVILLGDFLGPVDRLAAAVGVMASQGAQGHLGVIADPIEESFPIEGHVELQGSDTHARLRLGDARTIRDLYLKRLGEHREAIASIARRHGWTLSLHRTDAPAPAALMRIAGTLDAPLPGMR